ADRAHVRQSGEPGRRAARAGARPALAAAPRRPVRPLFPRRDGVRAEALPRTPRSLLAGGRALPSHQRPDARVGRVRGRRRSLRRRRRPQHHHHRPHRRDRRAARRLSVIGVDGPSVHLWRAALDVDDSTAAALAVTLSPDELAQSARLRRPQDRRRSLVAHGVRRQILGAYLDRRPDTLRYRRGLHGRPGVDEREASAGLEFSVSRSADLALYAVARERRVGVDVEALRPNFDWQPVAARYQTPAERATLEALPA